MGNVFKEMYGQYKGLSKSAYVIFFARIVTNMGAFIWPLLTMILSRKMGYSASTIAMLSLGIALVFIPGNIIGGKLADRFSRKKIIIIFDSISVIFFIACAFIEPGNLMTLFFVIAGLFANMEGPAFEALIADSSKPKEREKVFSLSYLGHNLGLVFGASVGGLLFENYLHIAFIFDALTTLTSTILIVIFVKTLNMDDLKDDEKNEYEEIEGEHITAVDILKDRKSIFYQLIIFSFGAFIYDQWAFVLPLYMDSLYAEKGAQLFGFLASFNGLVVIVFTPVLTMVLRKLHELPKTIIGLLLYSLSYLIIRNTDFYPFFLLMMLLFTLGEIVNMLGASPYISRRAPASHRGRINSYRSIGFFIGGIGGRLVTGILIENFSFSFTFLFLGGLGFVIAFFAILNYKYDQKVFPNLYKSNLPDAIEKIAE